MTFLKVLKQKMRSKATGRSSRRNTKATLTSPTGKKIETGMMSRRLIAGESIDDLLMNLHNRYSLSEIANNQELSMLHELLHNLHENDDPDKNVSRNLTRLLILKYL